MTNSEEVQDECERRKRLVTRVRSSEMMKDIHTV